MRNPRAAASSPKRPAPAVEAELQLLEGLLFDVLERSGYVNPRTRSSTRLKIRRLLRRMSLSARDAEIWLGMLRQIGWKLSRPLEGN